MKKIVEVKVRLVINLDDDVPLDEVMQEMDYGFTPQTNGAEMLLTEIKEYKEIN
jgi:hypothetical protein